MRPRLPHVVGLAVVVLLATAAGPLASAGAAEAAPMSLVQAGKPEDGGCVVGIDDHGEDSLPDMSWWDRLRDWFPWTSYTPSGGIRGLLHVRCAIPKSIRDSVIAAGGEVDGISIRFARLNKSGNFIGAAELGCPAPLPGELVDASRVGEGDFEGACAFPAPEWPGTTWPSAIENITEHDCVWNVALSFTAGADEWWVQDEEPAPTSFEDPKCDGVPAFVSPPGEEFPDDLGWPIGGAPGAADLSGCNGLTIIGDDVREVFLEPGDTVNMSLAAIDPDRPPAPMRVLVAFDPPGWEIDGWEEIVSWPSSPGWVFPVPEGFTDAEAWAFFLEGEDGSKCSRFYDPSGQGDGVFYEPRQPLFDLQECLDDARDFTLDPTSWGGAAIDHLICYAKRLVYPERALSWWVAKFQAAHRGTALGDVMDMVRVGDRTIHAIEAGAVEANTIEIGGRPPITIPQPPEPWPGRIRLAFTVVIGLAVTARIFAMVAAALGYRDVNAGE